MIALVLFWLASFGFAFIVGASKVSLPFRIALDPDPVARKHYPFLSMARDWLLMLVECPACIGFHCGWIGWIVIPQLQVSMPMEGALGALMLGAATCGVCFLLASVAHFPQEQS